MTFADHLHTHQDAHNGGGWTPSAKILVGDCLDRLKEVPDQTAQTCVTSPPYFGLRDYGVDGQIGLEATPDEFVAKMVQVFREVRRVLRDDGTVWLNLGDSYTGYWGEKYAHKPFGSDRTADESTPPNKATAFKDWGLKNKNLIGIPWRVAFALQADGWYLRQDIIWSKPNPMPESVTDRCTKAHEYIFLLSKSPRYHFDSEAIKEDAKTNDSRRPYTSKGAKDLDGRAEWKSGQQRDSGDFTKRNRRSVWTVTTKPFKGAHFATFPPALVEPCILAGAPRGSVVLDPFNGAGTTGLVALRNERDYIGCELNPEYASMAEARIRDDNPMMHQVETSP